MSAIGKVITGFSKPFVAKYTASAGVVTYSDGQELARGVSVQITPETSDPQNFYANNTIGETIGGEFKGGTATLTVDGLLAEARALICGLSEPDNDGFLHYGRSQKAPFVGLGFVIRYLSEGVTYYTPVILTKAVVNPMSLSANTQGEEVEFQTEEIEFTLSRDDTTNEDWQLYGSDSLATEADAIAKIKGIFNIV